MTVSKTKHFLTLCFTFSDHAHNTYNINLILNPIQDHFHQALAQWKLFRIWLDLWPQITLNFIFPYGHDYFHCLWAWSEDNEGLILIFIFVLCSLYVLFLQIFCPFRATSNLTWSLFDDLDWSQYLYLLYTALMVRFILHQ